MTRRQFLRKGTFAMGAAAVGTVGTAFWGAKACRVVEQDVTLKNLPSAFEGLRIAVLSDFHHSSIVPRDYLRDVVQLANAAKPDVIALCGDYITCGKKWVAPCFEELSELRAPLGVFGVLGNHDHCSGAKNTTKHAMRRAGIRELTNCGVWLRRDTARLRICGVGDLWRDRQELDGALAGVCDDETAVLLSHNPDYAEKLRDPRVGLMLSGHTHGGQCVFPFFGALRVPSAFGQKYVSGLCEGPTTQVFVTRGVGVIAIPLRFNCPPEVAILKLIV